MREIEYAPKLSILGERQKRLKILVGGRGSTKSTFVGDYVLACMANGQLWCCGREYQNTIDESVHRLLLEEIDRLEFDGFSSDTTHVYHSSGGRNFYRGLSRNPSGLKSSLTGVDGLWIEEGEKLSEETLRQMSASLRLSAQDIERSIAGEEIKMPEIWITMNRGSSRDPISQKWLKRAEPDLMRKGWYEDDYMLIVQINWDEIPRRWFEASGLEAERQDDLKNMTTAAYDHKWNGAYNDTVDNAIILPDWFDACVDAHVRLGFQPRGIEVVAHDPSDGGPDPKGLAYRHGVVFLDVQENPVGDVNEGCDWALQYALDRNVDHFIWDADGMGLGLRRQIGQAFDGKHTDAVEFHGGKEVQNPDSIYDRGTTENQKTNKQSFKNLRSQKYWDLRDRCYKTWLAVNGKYTDPDELISFSSSIEDIDLLRAEVCRIPQKTNGTGLIQIMTKAEMKKLEISSPNMADTVMMSLYDFSPPKRQPIQVNARPSINYWRAGK